MNHFQEVLLLVAIALMAVLHAYPTGEQESAQSVQINEQVGQPVVASVPQDETLGTAESAWGWGGYGRGWGGYGGGWGGYGRGYGGYGGGWGGYGRGWGGHGGWGRGWGYYG